jgi:hypothetical protein
VRAFLLHLSKRLCHVFELIPNIKAYVDRRGLLSRHRDTIARPRINLDDLLLFQFVLCAEDKSRKIGAALEIVDDYPFDLRSEGSQDVREQIMGERSLLFRALLEQRDRQTNALLNVNHENLVLVAKKNRTAAAGRSEAADLHFDNGLTHTAGLVTSLPAKIRIAFPFSFVPLLCQKFDPLEFQATVQRARVFGGRTYTLE